MSLSTKAEKVIRAIAEQIAIEFEELRDSDFIKGYKAEEREENAIGVMRARYVNVDWVEINQQRLQAI
jgi:hypothetical protein